MSERRCRILSADGRGSCAACGETWSAREAHVCPDRRQVRVARDDLAILVAMLTRSKPLVRTRRGTWFVPDWRAPDIRAHVVDRLAAKGLVAAGDRGGCRILTPAGRNAALNACSPETRAAHVA